MKHGGTKEETHDDASSSHHRHDRDHGCGHAQGVELNKVGSAEEHAYKHDAPMPMKRCGVSPFGPPQEHHGGEHHAHW